MSTPLSNRKFSKHLKRSKAKIKERLHSKVDRMIDRVYSQVLDDLEEFFTFDDDEVVRPKKIMKSTTKRKPISSPQSTNGKQHNRTSNITTPPDVATVPNGSQNGDNQFKNAFQTPIPQSTVRTTKQTPNIIELAKSKPTPPEPHRPIDIHSITQHSSSSSLPIVKDEIVSEFECKHYGVVDQKILDQMKREIKEEMPQLGRNNGESILASSFESQNAFDNSTRNVQHFHRVNGNGNSYQQQEYKQNANYHKTHDSVDMNKSKESVIPSVKNPKMNTTRSTSNGPSSSLITGTHQSSRTVSNQTQPINNDESTNEKKQIITLSLKCFKKGCSQVFRNSGKKAKLDRHMLNEHSIRKFRCAVKDCKRSFHSVKEISEHIRSSHKQWFCDKCPSHCPTYRQLSGHNIRFHQLGQFQCSFPECTFTGENRGKVYEHYKKHYRTFKCQYSGCDYLTYKAAFLRSHQRVHSGNRPFRCRWAGCDYASSERSGTIIHIRSKHLPLNFSGSMPNGALLDPSEYVEVVRELL